MIEFREIFEFIGSRFTRPWAWFTALLVMSILDLTTLAGLIWLAFLQSMLAIPPELLVKISIAYIASDLILALLVLAFSRIRMLRVSVIFYATYGLYFIIRGMFAIDGRTFSIVPWILVWIAALWAGFATFSSEYEKK